MLCFGIYENATYLVIEEKKSTSNKHFKVTIKDKRFVQHLLTFRI